MQEPADKDAASVSGGRLADTIRQVKNAAADRDDVVVDLREQQRTRLELLAEELKPVFADVPREDDRFDLAISAGNQPRLWIDCVAHVTMGRDRRTYRFLRDTRLGRVVLAESIDARPVAEQVTRYIAERIIERQRVLEGDVTHVALDSSVGETADVQATRGSRTGAVMRGIGMVLLGGIVGAGLVLLMAWERLAEFATGL
jgi:hypothetical protein